MDTLDDHMRRLTQSARQRTAAMALNIGNRFKELAVQLETELLHQIDQAIEQDRALDELMKLNGLEPKPDPIERHDANRTYRDDRLRALQNSANTWITVKLNNIHKQIIDTSYNYPEYIQALGPLIAQTDGDDDKTKLLLLIKVLPLPTDEQSPSAA